MAEFVSGLQPANLLEIGVGAGLSLPAYPMTTRVGASISLTKYSTAPDSGTLPARDTKSVCAESLCGLRAIASSRPRHLFPSNPLALHKILRLHGYRINLILGGDHTDFYGLKETYGAVDNYVDGTDQSNRYVNDDLLVLDFVSKLPAYDHSRPMLFQFHLMSSHDLGNRVDTPVFEPATNYYACPPGKPRTAKNSRSTSKMTFQRRAERL